MSNISSNSIQGSLDFHWRPKIKAMTIISKKIKLHFVKDGDFGKHLPSFAVGRILESRMISIKIRPVHEDPLEVILASEMRLLYLIKKT